MRGPSVRLENNRLEIMIAGRGGQGILLAGYILGLALAKFKGYYVVNSESYSAETRGGESRSELIVFRSSLDADLIRINKADIAVFMYSDQMFRYVNKVKDEATVILDSTFIDKPCVDSWRTYSLPFTTIAERELGNLRVANMVMLGAFSKITGLIDVELLVKAVREVISPRWIEINVRAIRTGAEYAASVISND